MTELVDFEKTYWDNGEVILGLDEAGYGCLAGSMFIAGVIFPMNFIVPPELQGVRDSKKTDRAQRATLAAAIKKFATHSFVLEVDVSTINAGSAYHLRFSAPQSYINTASFPENTRVIMDGDRSIEKIPYGSESLIKGDSKSFSIAAASILAKNAKDLEMDKLHLTYPSYGFDTNQGYGTELHINAIRKMGVTAAHRAAYVKRFE